MTEPSIPVLWPDGTGSSIGIREVFLRAHEIRDIQGDNPLERYALLRLLIVFAMDMLHPADSYARRALLEAGKFDPDVFDEYITVCEKEGPRFDLFDADHPFLQSKYDEKLDAKAEKPVAAIIHSLPSGNNHIFIDHRYEKNTTLSYDKALQVLCATYLFSVSGLAGSGKPNMPSSVNNTPPLYCTIVGNNLFDTIIINMLSYDELGIGGPWGVVPWKKECSVTPYKTFADISIIDGMLWLPRRITLIPSTDQLIHTIFFQAGNDFRGNNKWKDPYVPRIIQNKTMEQNVLPRLGRELWRDVASLLYDNSNSRIRQPQVIKCLWNIIDDNEIPNIINVRLSGLITKKAAYVLWNEYTLSIPPVVLNDQEAADLFRQDVDMIEITLDNLVRAIEKYVGVHEIATQCQQFFLQSAHDLLFGSALDEILHGIPEKDHVAHFCNALKDTLRETVRQVIRNSGQDVKSIMQQMEAEKWIWISYRKLCEERRKHYV